MDFPPKTLLEKQIELNNELRKLLEAMQQMSAAQSSLVASADSLLTAIKDLV